MSQPCVRIKTIVQGLRDAEGDTNAFVLAHAADGEIVVVGEAVATIALDYKRRIVSDCDAGLEPAIS